LVLISSSSVSSSEAVIELSADCVTQALGSVAERIWLTRRPAYGISLNAVVLKLMRMLLGTFRFLASLFEGDGDRGCGIWLTASIRSLNLSVSLPRRLADSSSSLPDEAESGGEMMAPLGIPFSSVMGGGDWRTDVATPAMLLRSSDVPWGVKVAEEPSLAAETEGVLRCLLR
jgi:hypothetical protein